MKNAVQITTLDNGFRIISENIAGFESAVVGVWAGVGARFETPAQNGIAHFLEHMAFKGTTSRTSLQIAESIENVGGYMNAYTGRETTAYYARVLRADTGLALDITSDIVLNAIFDATGIGAGTRRNPQRNRANARHARRCDFRMVAGIDLSKSAHGAGDSWHGRAGFGI